MTLSTPPRHPLRWSPVLGALLWLLLGWAVPAGAQGELTGSVAVTIRDDQGAPLPGVMLTLQSSAISLHGVTGPDGTHRFLVVPADHYTLRGELDGFLSAVMEGIDVRFGETYTASLVLALEEFEEEVTVVSAPSQMDMTQTTTRELLQKDFVKEVPLRDRNFEDLVDLLPGVSDNRVQGSRSTSTGFRIDGASNVDPYFSDVAITFSQQAIDRFELVSNGFSPRYGDYSGGVVNVTTRSGGNALEGHLGYFFRDTEFVADPPVSYPDQVHDKAPDDREFFEAAVGGPVVRDKLHYFATAEYRTSDVGNVFAVRTSETDAMLASLKLNYVPRGGDVWSIFAATNLYDTSNTVADRFTAPEFNADETDDRFLLSVHQNHVFRDDLFLESQLSALSLESELSRTDPDAHPTLYVFQPDGTYTKGRYSSESDRRRVRLDFDETLTWITDRHELGLGLNLGYLDSQVDQDIGPTIFDLRPIGVPFAYHYVFEPVVYREDGFESALFVQDTWRPTARASVQLGARVDYQEANDNVDFAPRAGFSFDLTRDGRTKLFGNWGVYYERVFGRYLEWGSQPGGTEYFVVNPVGELADGELTYSSGFKYRIAGDDATPYANTWSVGVERLLTDTLRAAVVYTDKRLRHQLLTYTVAEGDVLWYEFRPDGEGRYEGADLIVTKRFSDGWEARGSYTWSESRGQGGTLGQFFLASQIPPEDSVDDFDQTHVIKLSALGHLPWGIGISGSYQYASGLPYSVIGYTDAQEAYYAGGRNSYRMPSTQSLDVSVQKVFALQGLEVTLVAEGFNLTNHENVIAVSDGVEEHGEPTAFDVGRTYQFGVRFDL